MNGTIFTYKNSFTKHFVRAATADECIEAVKDFDVAQLNAGGVFTSDIYIGAEVDAKAQLNDVQNWGLIQVIVPAGTVVRA